MLDLGDDVHAAAHLNDLAAHGYALRGVRLPGVGASHVVAYYDGEHQSDLTQEQRDLVRAWVRRRAALGGPSLTADAGASVSASRVATLAAAEATEPAVPDASADRDSPLGPYWFAPALLSAVIALALAAYAVAVTGPSTRSGPGLAAVAAVLALISAVVTGRDASVSRVRSTGQRDAGRGRVRHP